MRLEVLHRADLLTVSGTITIRTMSVSTTIAQAQVSPTDGGATRGPP